MATVHLIHGFNVRDGGAGTIGSFAPYLEAEGLDVINHSYGWTGLLRLRCKNRRAVKDIIQQIKPGDILLAHSNGALVNWLISEEIGRYLGGVICIQPALRKDTMWHPGLQVVCYYNRKDWIVSLGRIWGRFVSVVRPWRGRHGWGAAGRHGFTTGQSGVYNVDTLTGPAPVGGHSTIMKPGRLYYWGPQVAKVAARMALQWGHDNR